MKVFKKLKVEKRTGAVKMIIFLGNAHSHELYKDLIEKSKADKPDIVVSCQYPHKVPESLIKSHICVNIHYGILPYFAGCNPIYHQIIESDEAGVTLHYMDENFDSGDIIRFYYFPIGNMTADEVYDACAIGGKELFEKYYHMILNATAPREPQNLSFRRYYPKTMVDFKNTLCNIGDKNRIRALHFAGKQYPTIEIGKNVYELRKVGEK